MRMLNFYWTRKGLNFGVNKTNARLGTGQVPGGFRSIHVKVPVSSLKRRLDALAIIF